MIVSSLNSLFSPVPGILPYWYFEIRFLFAEFLLYTCLMSRISFKKRNNSGYVFAGGNWTKGTGNYKTMGSAEVSPGPAGLLRSRGGAGRMRRAGCPDSAIRRLCRCLPRSQSRKRFQAPSLCNQKNQKCCWGPKRQFCTAAQNRIGGWMMGDSVCGSLLARSPTRLLKSSTWRCMEVGTQRCLGLFLHRKWVRS